ncbi:MAG: HEAT repeat domain-containing protein [bacterium]
MGGSAAHRPALEAALADAHWRVRVAAAEGLRRIGDPASIPALRRHVRDEHPVVENAVGFALRSLEGRTG